MHRVTSTPAFVCNPRPLTPNQPVAVAAPARAQPPAPQSSPGRPRSPAGRLAAHWRQASARDLLTMEYYLTSSRIKDRLWTAARVLSVRVSRGHEWMIIIDELNRRGIFPVSGAASLEDFLRDNQQYI